MAEAFESEPTKLISIELHPNQESDYFSNYSELGWILIADHLLENLRKPFYKRTRNTEPPCLQDKEPHYLLTIHDHVVNVIFLPHATIERAIIVYIELAAEIHREYPPQFSLFDFVVTVGPEYGDFDPEDILFEEKPVVLLVNRAPKGQIPNFNLETSAQECFGLKKITQTKCSKAKDCVLKIKNDSVMSNKEHEGEEAKADLAKQENRTIKNEKRSFARAFGENDDELLCKESQPMKNKPATVAHGVRIIRGKDTRIIEKVGIIEGNDGKESVLLCENRSKAGLIEERVREKNKVIVELHQLLERDWREKVRLLEEKQRNMELRAKEDSYQGLLLLAKKDEEIGNLRAQVRQKDNDIKELVEELKEKEKLIANNKVKFFRSLLLEMEAKEKAIDDQKKADGVIKSLHKELETNCEREMLTQETIVGCSMLAIQMKEKSEVEFRFREEIYQTRIKELEYRLGLFENCMSTQANTDSVGNHSKEEDKNDFQAWLVNQGRNEQRGSLVKNEY